MALENPDTPESAGTFVSSKWLNFTLLILEKNVPWGFFLLKKKKKKLLRKVMNANEWVIDCCLTPNISSREQVKFQWEDDEVHFVAVCFLWCYLTGTKVCE